MAGKASKQKDTAINIKALPVQMHIGSQKYINDDWGTMAYIIDRREVQNKFTDPELRYNCIYFLFGYENTTEMCYVGQAKKRNSGESVLARLREHDQSTTEKYSEVWDWAVVVTNKNDSWTLDDLNALENIFYSEIPAEQRLNGNTPNAGGADFNEYDDKTNQIKALISAIGFSIFTEKTEVENIQVTSETNEFSIVEDLQNGMARIPEIVTPHKVVKAMVDMLPDEVWNSHTVFLDPACKGGEYLREIYDRLMDNELLQSEFPNTIERSNHILNNQIYGIALSQVSLERATKKLLGFGNNIKIIPNYIDVLKVKFNNSEEKKKYIKEKLKEAFGKEMTFDVVIGNPPYQKINGTGIGAGNQSGESIYQLFIVNSCRISDIVCMITPTKWFAGNKALDDMRATIMNSHMTSINILDAKKVFHIIMDKVCFFCWNKKYQGKTQIVDYTYSDNNDTRYINKLGIDCFILNKYDTSIYEKVNIITKEYTEKIIKNNPFGLETNIYGNATRTSNTELKLHYTGYKFQGDNVGFIEASDVTRGKELFNKYKVIFNRGASTNEIIFTMIICAEPGEICTRSFVVAGPFDNKNDSNNMIKYLKTKMVRTLIRIRKSDQTLYADKFRFVPLQDFTSNSDIDWSQSISDIDQQLYKKYNLTQDEINYIEKTIKPIQ